MDVLTLLRSQWDRLAALGCVIAGVVLLVLGYHGVANSAYVADELSYLVSDGLGGLFLLGVAASLFSSADMHDEWRKLDRIEEAIRDLAGTGVTVVPDPSLDRTGNHLEPTPRATHRGGGVLAMPRELNANLRLNALTTGFGAVLLGLAYARTANVAEARPAVTATAFGVLALIVAAVGSMVSRRGLRRRLLLRRATLLAPFSAVVGRTRPAPRAVEHRVNTNLLLIPGGTYAHTAGCAMLTGEPTTAVHPTQLPSGVRPCALCSADSQA